MNSEAPRLQLRRLLWSRWVLATFALGLGLRIWVLMSSLGSANADETYTGLQSVEILHGHLPVVIGAIRYTAPLESYLYAPFVAVFGLHTVPLKLLPSIGWLIASVLMIGAARRIVNDATALLAGALIWLAPGALLVVATRAYEAYSTGLAIVVAALWAVLVAVQRAEKLRPRDSVLAGFLLGLAFYAHPMFLAVALPMGATATWVHRRRVRAWLLPAALSFFAANSLFILWNAINQWPSLSQPAVETNGPLSRFAHFFDELAPRVFGLRKTDGSWVYGVGLSLALYLAVGCVIVIGVVQLARSRRADQMVVVSVVVVSWFVMAGFTNLSFVIDGRYGIINFPFLALAFAVGAQHLLRSRSFANLWLVVAWVALFTVPWVTQQGGRDIGDPNAQITTVISILSDRGFDSVAGTYWLVFPLEYVSGQEIRVAVSGHPYVILLPDSQRLVQATPSDRLAFLFAAPAPEALLMYPVDQYELIRVGSLYLYLPTAASS